MLFVDADHFVQQPEVVAALTGDSAESFQIFGETGTAVADSGTEKAIANARVATHPGTHLLNVGVNAFTDIRYRIDE